MTQTQNEDRREKEIAAVNKRANNILKACDLIRNSAILHVEAVQALRKGTAIENLLLKAVELDMTNEEFEMITKAAPEIGIGTADLVKNMGRWYGIAKHAETRSQALGTQADAILEELRGAE